MEWKDSGLLLRRAEEEYIRYGHDGRGKGRGNGKGRSVGLGVAYRGYNTVPSRVVGQSFACSASSLVPLLSSLFSRPSSVVSGWIRNQDGSSCAVAQPGKRREAQPLRVETAVRSLLSLSFLLLSSLVSLPLVALTARGVPGESSKPSQSQPSALANGRAASHASSERWRCIAIGADRGLQGRAGVGPGADHEDILWTLLSCCSAVALVLSEILRYTSGRGHHWRSWRDPWQAASSR